MQTRDGAGSTKELSFWEKLSKNINDFYKDVPYQPTFGHGGYQIGTALEKAKKAKENTNSESIATTPPATPPPISGGSFEYDYYATARAALEEAYAEARKQAEATKTDSIASAYDKYVRASQSYGVEAQNLNDAGLSESGGYGQLMSSNRFNAYSNLENSANSAYAKALTDISLAKSQESVNLELQKYQEQMAKEQNKYNNLQSQLSAAQGVTASWAKFDGKKIVNEQELRRKLKSNFDLNDDYIDSVINSIMNG